MVIFHFGALFVRMRSRADRANASGFANWHPQLTANHALYYRRSPADRETLVHSIRSDRESGLAY